MGCAASSFDLAVQNSQSMKKNLAQYSLLQLSDSDVRKLYAIFHGIDENNGDTVVLVEVLAHINLPHKGFTAKIFSAYTDNDSGTIDFNEFVLALWNFCTLNKGTLDTFVFDLYDKDGTGELSSTQMLNMIEEIYGKNESKTNADMKPVITELQDFERRKVVFTLDRFRSFVKKHPAMLVPVSHAMQVLQNKTLGANSWDRLAEKRMKLSSGRYLSVRKFIAAQGSGKPYTSLSTPGQSRDDENHPQDFSHDAEGHGAQGRPPGAIKTPATTTSFELSDSAGDSPCMTTSSKPSNGGLSDSAKVRWTASLQSLVTAVSAKSSRRSKTNKVHASPKSGFGSSSGSGHGRSKNKSRHNSNSADGDLPDSAKAPVASSPTSAFSKATAATTTTTSSSSVVNVDPGNGSVLETVRRKSVTFGEMLEGVPVVPTAAAVAEADAAGSRSPKNANSARGGHASKDVSPRPAGGASATSASAGAEAGANASNSPTASPTHAGASSARSSALPPSTSSQRRGSKDIVIWSNDSQPTQPTGISPKNAMHGHSPKSATNNNNNKNFNGHNHGHNSNTSTPASTARTGMNNENKDTPFAAFNDKLAFVPHDDAALAVRSRPAARRSVILPGAVEDAQELNEYMNLHQRCRSLE